MNQGLRERQKATRRARILNIARRKFQEFSYSNVTIEDIAHGSDVSAVTVYNYFGSKAGILLALVVDSDELLIEKLDDFVRTYTGDLVSGVLTFGRILRHHAMSYLQKPTWREVLGASILEGSREFGKTYFDLDAVLVRKMEELILALQDQGTVSATVNAASLADCFFSLQNVRFFQFIADDEISLEESDARLKADLLSLQAVFSPVPTAAEKD